MHCLIIGAGLSGLTAANCLQQNGHSVTILDKGRNPGGRMATRTIGDARLDHGAQFFTARDPRFRQAVDTWLANGWIAPWFQRPDGATAYRAIDGMNQLAAHLAAGHDLHLATTVTQIERTQSNQWRADSFQADRLLITAPTPQAAKLLPEAAPALQDYAYDPCFALMAVLDSETSPLPTPGYLNPKDHPAIDCVSDNTAKGLNTGPVALTIHATPAWTRRHLDTPKETVAALLLAEARPWLTAPIQTHQIHRWLYARPARNNGPAFLPGNGYAIAGDAFGGPRIEGAYLSGLAAAQWILCNP